FLHHDRAFDAGVVRQSAGRELNGALDDVHPDPFIIVGDLHGFDRRQATDQGHATAWHDAFFNRGASRMQRVFDTGLLLLHFGLGRRADVDDPDTTGQLGQAFLQFLAIVVGGGFLDLTTDLIDPALDLGGFTEPFDDGGVFFVHHNALGAAEVVEFKALQFDAEVFADELGASQNGDVFAHGFAAVAEAGSFHRADVERAAEFVDHQRGQCFALDFL